MRRDAFTPRRAELAKLSRGCSLVRALCWRMAWREGNKCHGWHRRRYARGDALACRLQLGKERTGVDGARKCRDGRGASRGDEHRAVSKPKRVAGLSK